MEHFKVVSVVWGADYTKWFVKVCLASQLTPGNLEYLARHASCSYRIYTPARDAKVIRRSAAYRRLAELMPVEIATISGIWRAGKYGAVNHCCSHFISSTKGQECALIFAHPDVVWADGAGVRLLEIVRSGKRMMAINTPPLVKETFVPAFLERYGCDGLLRPVAPRELVELAMRHLHPDVTAAVRDPTPKVTPSAMYWMTDGGPLVREFHVSGVMVIPADRDVVPTEGLDADYTLTACPDMADVYVVSDSDDICLFEFIPAPKEGQINSRSTEQLAQWANGTNARHREFVKFRLRYHWSDLSEVWKAAEDCSDATVDSILRRLDTPHPVSEVASPSRWRYLSPRFLNRKIRELSVRGFLRQSSATLARTVLRRVYGSQVRISLPAASPTSNDETVRPQ